MERIFVFLAIVFIGVLAIIIFSNQVKPTPANPNLDSILGATGGVLKPSVIAQNLNAAKNKPTITPIDETPISPTPSSPSAEIASTATIKTSKGEIVLSFYSLDAPKTVENFVNKVKSGFYDNLTFHRVEDWVIQGGDPKGDGTGGGNMPVEFNSKPFVVGSLGVASRGDGKVQNDAQFFITKKDASWLNGQYTNFGIVTKGMDVVEKMEIGDKILGISFE